MKKYGVFFLVIVISTNMFIGCKNTSENAKVNNIKKAQIIITGFSMDYNFNWNGFSDPVAKEITKETGVTLEMEYPVGGIDEEAELMMAGKNYDDIIHAKGAELAKLVEAGALIDMTPLIEKYGANIKKLYGSSISKLRYSNEDKSIYELSSNPVKTDKLEPVAGFQVQHEVLKEFGYPKMETLQDYENVIKEYKNKYPTIDGKPTIGISLVADDWRWNISVGNSAAFATGAPDDGNWYIDTNTHEAIYHFLRPEEKKYFAWLNHLNDIGLLDQESFVQKNDQYISKISSGRVLGLIDAKWEYNEGELSLKSQGKYNRTYGIYPIQVDGTTKDADFRESEFAAGWGFGISSTCKDPVAVIKFLDWMCSEKALVLTNWGIEGINYTIKDGKRFISPLELNKKNTDKDYIKKTGIGNYTYPFPCYGIGQKDSKGDYFMPITEESVKDSYNSVEKETLAAYGKSMWKDLYPQSNELAKSDWGAAYNINIPEGSELENTIKNAETIMKEELPKVILSAPNNFDENWQNLQKKLYQIGIEKANKEFTKIIKKMVTTDVVPGK